MQNDTMIGQIGDLFLLGKYIMIDREPHGNSMEAPRTDPMEKERSLYMFRLWAKTFKDNRIVQDVCIEDSSIDTRTHKVFNALSEVCYQFDLGKPVWLKKDISDFKRHNKARFTQDNFIETIEFDYLEIQVIEED